MTAIERLLFALFIVPVIAIFAWIALVTGCVINIFTGHLEKDDG